MKPSASPRSSGRAASVSRTTLRMGVCRQLFESKNQLDRAVATAWLLGRSPPMPP
ncbi:MAG TPA: hypothetical protein PLR87_15420 [Thermoanaerobaculaceae bacterium]|nr:hypothetical protein [Thermoanaerobaculaceae bacterium]